jgi:hypothetical protein
MRWKKKYGIDFSGLELKPRFTAFSARLARETGAAEAGTGSALAVSPRSFGNLPLQDGQMLDGGSPTLAMLFTQFLEQVFPKVGLLNGGANLLASLLVLEVDVRQSLQERLKQRLEIRRIHAMFGLRIWL